MVGRQAPPLPILIDCDFVSGDMPAQYLPAPAQTLALDVVRLVSEGVTDVIIKADALFRQKPVSPRPDGYRIRENDGPVVYEFLPSQIT